MTTTPTAARVSGTIKADAARLADQAETLAAPLVGQHETLRSHHLETAAALRILAAIQPDPELEDRPSDGTCKECGCAPINPEGLCSSCKEEEEEEELTTPSSAGTVSVEAAALESIADEMRETYREMLIGKMPTELEVHAWAEALRALAGERG